MKDLLLLTTIGSAASAIDSIPDSSVPLLILKFPYSPQSNFKKSPNTFSPTVLQEPKLLSIFFSPSVAKNRVIDLGPFLFLKKIRLLVCPPCPWSILRLAKSGKFRFCNTWSPWLARNSTQQVRFSRFPAWFIFRLIFRRLRQWICNR